MLLTKMFTKHVSDVRRTSFMSRWRIAKLMASCPLRIDGLWDVGLQRWVPVVREQNIVKRLPFLYDIVTPVSREDAVREAWYWVQVTDNTLE